MLLAIDIGNSNIVLGIFDGEQCTTQIRVETSLEKQAPEYEVDLRTYFLEKGLSLSQIKQIVISSVVPRLTPVVQQVVQNLWGIEPLLINAKLYEALSLNLASPHEIGSDLVANAVAGYAQAQQACIVVDFGTALTFTAINQEGDIMGVNIAPGLKTAMYSLFAKTAQLPEVPLELPDSAIGKNTPQALQAGVLFGYIGLVKEMLTRMKAEMPSPCLVLATGGLVQVLSPLEPLFDTIDKNLTLRGLLLLQQRYERIYGKKPSKS